LKLAHFARIENNLVTQVIVVNNKDTSTPDGTEVESIGVAFCQRLFGGNWLKTSYNNNIRKNYAGVGYTYDSGRDAFIPPKPFNSWVLNENTCQWEAPTPMPTDDNSYMWDEENLIWQQVSEQLE
jgi:hypothetical protein